MRASRLENSLSEPANPRISERVRELQQCLADEDIQVAVVRLPENVVLLSGYWPQMSGTCCVAVALDADPILILPDHEEDEASRTWPGEIKVLQTAADSEAYDIQTRKLLRAFAKRHKLDTAHVGIEQSFELVAPPRFDGEPGAVGLPLRRLIEEAFATRSCCDVSPLLEKMRRIKSAGELERLRVTNRIAAFGLAVFQEEAMSGQTEAGVAAAVQSAIMVNGHGFQGAAAVRAYPAVCSGRRTENAWHYMAHTERVIGRDDVVMLELGTCVDGFWSDHSRTVFLGSSEGSQEALAAVKYGTAAAIDAASAGANGGEIDRASRAAVSAAGFEQHHHHTGHGTGLRYHESAPTCAPGSTDQLEPGMVVAIEPGLYIEGFGGFRIEDNWVLTEDGMEPLLGSTEAGAMHPQGGHRGGADQGDRRENRA